MFQRLLSPLTGSIAAALLAGCTSLHYVGQAAGGEAAILASSRPIDDVLADPATPPALAKQLQLAQRLRAFAIAELKLPDNASYTRYADLGRPFALWNVVSTPALSLRPVESCFPIAGCLGYRGYYSRADAEHYADERRAAGDDVFLYGIPAYSTLGWFRDPLLNTTLQYGELSLARLVFHELAHQRVYVKDDSSFNEAFATAVEEEGLLRWLAQSNRPELIARFGNGQARQAQFMAMMQSTRQRLVALYAGPLSRSDKLAEKQRIQADALASYQALKAQWGGEGGYDLWFDPLPNNAHFASLSTYRDKVPAFRALLRAKGGDFAAFYDAVRALGDKSRSAREADLAAIVAAGSEPGRASP
jgi:predicted aminopeptidase